MNEFKFSNQELEIEFINYLINRLSKPDKKIMLRIGSKIFNLKWNYIDQFIEPYTYSLDIYAKIDNITKAWNITFMDSGEIFQYYENLLSRDRHRKLNTILR